MQEHLRVSERLANEHIREETVNSHEQPNLLFETAYQAKYNFAYHDFMGSTWNSNVRNTDVEFIDGPADYIQQHIISARGRSYNATEEYLDHETDVIIDGVINKQIYSVLQWFGKENGNVDTSLVTNQLRGELRKVTENIFAPGVNPLPSTLADTTLLQAQDWEQRIVDEGTHEIQADHVAFFYEPGAHVIVNNQNLNSSQPGQAEHNLAIKLPVYGGEQNYGVAAPLVVDERTLQTQSGIIPFQPVVDKAIEFFIPYDHKLYAQLERLDFKNTRYIVKFGTQPSLMTFEADVLHWRRNVQTTNIGDGERAIARHNVLTCWMKLSDADLAAGPFALEQPAAGSGQTTMHGKFTNCARPTTNMFLQIEETGDTAAALIRKQGLTYSKVVPDAPLRLFPGDSIVSSFPNVDSLSEFSQVAVTSSEGFLFRGEKNMGFNRPVLVSVPIPLPLNTSFDSKMRLSGASTTPMSDIYYSSRNTPQMHQLETNLPLRSGTLEVVLESRDGTRRVPAMLKPRGRFDCKLFFMRNPN